MIKVKIKNGKTKIKVSGNEMWVAMEIVHGMACCIEALTSGDKAEFDRVKDDVISKLAKITLTEDGERFRFDSEE